MVTKKYYSNTIKYSYYFTIFSNNTNILPGLISLSRRNLWVKLKSKVKKKIVTSAISHYTFYIPVLHSTDMVFSNTKLLHAVWRVSHRNRPCLYLSIQRIPRWSREYPLWAGVSRRLHYDIIFLIYNPSVYFGAVTINTDRHLSTIIPLAHQTRVD